jgi:hypothetical protein
VEKYCRENNIPFRILLIANNGPSHPAHLDDIHASVEVVFRPRTTTSILQPMDQGVITNLEAFYGRTTAAQAVKETNNGLILREF